MGAIMGIPVTQIMSHHGHPRHTDHEHHKNQGQIEFQKDTAVNKDSTVIIAILDNKNTPHRCHWVRHKHQGHHGPHEHLTILYCHQGKDLLKKHWPAWACHQGHVLTSTDIVCGHLGERNFTVF
jgi:hypothetical protein